MLNITVRDVQPDDALEICWALFWPDQQPLVLPAASKVEVTCSRSLAIPNEAIVVRLIDKNRQLKDVQTLPADPISLLQIEKAAAGSRPRRLPRKA